MMDTAPLVSAIIIFLDARPYLAEAIDSVFAQSYGNWELLLVDDGSTDGSSDIARVYADRHPVQVRYLSHPGHENRGMSASRNLGLRHARGDYVGFLDADDVWLPGKLEQQVAILEAEPAAAMVYGRTEIWHSWTGRPKDRGRDFFYDLGIAPDRVVSPPRLFVLLMENKAQSPTTCNALMRRSLFDRIGGFEETFRGMFEDQVFFAKLHLQAPTYVADATWARYRQHPESCSSRAADGEDEAARLPMLRWTERYLIDEGIRDPEAWQALRRELDRYRWLRARKLARRLLPLVSAR